MLPDIQYKSGNMDQRLRRWRHTETETLRERDRETERQTEKDRVIMRRPTEISCSTTQDANAGKKSIRTSKQPPAYVNSTLGYIGDCTQRSLIGIRHYLST